MNEARLYQIIQKPIVSEKATNIAESSRQFAFRVAPDATKQEVREAVEKIFNVDVVSTNILNIQGKRKRTRFGLGQRNRIRKAYVRIKEGQDIDFLESK